MTENIFPHRVTLRALKHVLSEWQLARDRFELPEADPKVVAQREKTLHDWERQLRGIQVDDSL